MTREPPARLTIGLHSSLRQWEAEVTYVFRTLLSIAGYAWTFADDQSGGRGPAQAAKLDIYYGPDAQTVPASLAIVADSVSYADAAAWQPHTRAGDDSLPFVTFVSTSRGADAHHRPSSEGAVVLRNDIVRTAYWLLSGAHESAARRDNRDNLSFRDTFFFNQRLVDLPIVSLYGRFIHDHFARAGRPSLPLPWTPGTMALTHDVDYPDIIKWIECLRLLGRGRSGLHLARRVLRGESHFWQFPDWVAFEASIGAAGAFYFLARQGSLWQYATGTPDGFYDVRDRRFRALFAELKDAGCEIGLHASYRAYEDGSRLAAEKQRLEEAAGTFIRGVRHHYWRLDPEAPHRTLAAHQAAGLDYDSSLGLEFYPGFRRGICHPYRVFDPDARRELDLVEVPPTWMDDHFGRRRNENRIADPVAYARRCLDIVTAAGGVAVLDYHVRGMNDDFFPEYGPWLRTFLDGEAHRPLTFALPSALARAYRTHRQHLGTD